MSRPFSKSIQAGFHVFGLAAFAWSLPLFLVVSGNDAWFLLYGAGRLHVIAFALVAGIALPAFLGVSVGLLSRVLPSLREVIVSVAVAILATLAVLPNASRLPLFGWGIVIGSIMLGAVVGYYYPRSAPLRRMLSLLALLAPAYFIWFLANSSMVFPASHPKAPVAIALNAESRPPIAVLILDEFSTQTLLNPDRSLNRSAFPNFGRLADHATWFRNASTVADMTTEAVPAILTGRYPIAGQRLAPTWQNHPGNLFTLLHAQDYEVFAGERLTALCPDPMNRAQGAAPNGWGELRSFLSDTAIVTAHMYAPDEFAKTLPPIKGRIGRFATRADPDADPFDAHQGLSDDLDTPRFRGFLSEIDSSEARLYVFHIVLPHHPYVLLPSGKRMVRLHRTPPRQWTPYVSYDESWPPDPAIVAADMQRYLHQAQFVDTLIGEFMDRLQAVGIYDEAAVVVAADHGVSFRPESPFRLPFSNEKDELTSVNAGLDIIKVPVFIKFPGQKAGQIVDTPFQTIDIVPTVLDAIGATDLVQLDGRPFWKARSGESNAQRFYASTTSGFHEHDLDLLAPAYDVASKFAMLDFERGFTPRTDLYDRIVKDPPSDVVASSPAAFSLVVEQAEDFDHVGLDSEYLPAYLRARIPAETEPDRGTPIAILVNDRFATVAQVYPRHGSLWITVVLDTSLFVDGANTLTFYQVQASDSDLRYHPIAWSPG